VKKLFILFTLLSFSCCTLYAQQQSWPGKFYKGYTRSLTTGKFSYHSPQPDVTESLLLRSIDSASFISWETESIPADFKDPYANFVWMFGIDANPESHTYRIYVNGTYCLTFANPVVSEIKPWTVTGKNGCSLTFLTTMLDKYDDPMGYAVLKLPSIMIRKGEPQVIKVVGESAGSNVWYMTFESAVEEKLDILQEEAVVRNGDKPCYSVLFNFVHLGTEVTGKLQIDSQPDINFRLQPGFNRIPVLLPASLDSTHYVATIILQGQPPVHRDFIVHPVRHWTIYLVEHAHTDIGYTRPQTEILPEHMRYIDYALDYCDQTDSLPEEARFRWTCETSWALSEYLNSRPAAQIERLKKRVAEGRIELTGLFLNSSDLSDEATIASYLQPVKQFRDAGIPITAAMQDDINGVPWCLVDYLDGCGIHYLSMGQNDTRALKPFDRPTTFWWQSPSGNRILVNRPEHYMFGNSLGILTNANTFGQALFQHLSNIMKKGYPYDHYAIQFSGYLTDNSPPSTTACRLVEEWNKKYIWPRLQLATISEFGKYMVKEHAQEIPVYRGAWPDWWIDGFGSACMETAYTRQAHEDFIANQGLMAMAVMMHSPIPDHLGELSKEISTDLAFYDEHTFGAAESITDPRIENSMVQWNEKAAFTWDAVKKNGILKEEIMGILQDKLPHLNCPSITVFNTLSWPRSGIVKVYIDHQLLPLGRSFNVVDELNRTVPIQQMESREEGTYWALYATDVPPMGFTNYRIILGKENRTDNKIKFTGILENKYYRLRINPVKGTIKSLYDKKLGKELVDTKSAYQPGQFIYERLGKNRHQLEVLKLDEATRTVLQDVHVSPDITDGPVWQSISLHGSMPECAEKDGITCEIRLYKTVKKIELYYSLKKLSLTDPEGGYIAFPFQLDNGHLVFEVQGGTVRPGKDQLEGSASDWNGIQNFVSLKNENSQVVLVSPEIPVVQLGALNLGKFSRIANPETNSIFSWVFNNYWTTNFRAYQEGELKWTYELTSSEDTSNVFSTTFGWNERIPMPARIFSAKGKDTLSYGKSFIYLPPDFLLIDAKPSFDKTGIILQIREIAGNNSSITWHDVISSWSGLQESSGAASAFEINVLGDKISEVNKRIEFKPFETKFIKLVINQ
jgi:alpha-mannosidase